MNERLSQALMAQQQAFRHLALGKALSAGLGLLVLAVWWRALSPTAYGQYLVLLALLEIITLVSAAGLSSLTQRHLPVWVAHATQAASALAIVLVVLGLRGLLALGVAALMWWTALAWLPDAVSQLGAVWWFAWILSGTLVRSLEEVQSSLLLQAWVQGLGLATQAMRLCAIALAPPTGAAQFEWLVTAEASVASVVVVAGLIGVAISLRRRRSGQDPMTLEAPVSWGLAWRASLGFWAIQCLGLSWSLHALRLLAQSVAGPAVLAVHAAAQALMDACRQASPLVWMSAWLRAAMLRLQALEPSGRSAWHLAFAVERGSAVFLWPTLAAWCVEPSAWLRTMAGPTLYAEAQQLSLLQPAQPALTSLLVAAAALLPLQNRHLALSGWFQTRQRWGWGLTAAAAAACWCFALLPLWPWIGLWSVPLVMVMAEATWVGIVSWAWRLQQREQDGRDDICAPRAASVPLWAVALVALLGAGVASGLLDLAEPVVTGSIPSSVWSLWSRLALPWLSAALAVWALLRARPLWSSAEAAVLSACLPRSLAVSTRLWRHVPRSVRS